MPGGVQSVRVALAQIDVVPRDPQKNAASLGELIYAHADADILVAPELALTGCSLIGLPELAATPEHAFADIARVCAETATAFIGGYVEAGPGLPYNSMVVIDATGTIVANYRKTHLFDAESTVITPGRELMVVPLAGIQVGLLICFDMEFPEVSRTLAGMGAELLVGIAANFDPMYNDQLIATQARALDNRLPFVYVNRVGAEWPVQFNGGSRAITADGYIIADAGPWETVTTVEVPLHSVMGPAVQYRTQLRPELYHTVLRQRA